ncbi:MAG: chromosome segregation protein SMC [Pseudomonadota bacterium]
MKIKKLEINGFKSFYEKASIEFPPGISAVVGPNGCGKSNIVDALRWVMGEQSVKQLRGKSMEDVIFAGTNGKTPLSLAEVTLTLLNDNGSAPEELNDFTEIMLTRRLYRSGESAYFINKQPCRLKDIHNIFMGSGLASKSYAVVQQGNIGAITDAGPEERRFLIEEAAGITRYKSRKTEALRKLEATNQNLLRVNDIIMEVQRQMAGLKRQARKAERYKKYQDRIKSLDIGLALHYYDDYTRKINETDALLKDLEDTDIGHTSQIKKLDAAIEEIKFRRSQKNQEISEQKSRVFETQRNIDRMENDLAHLHKDIERLANEIAGLESAREDLEKKDRNITAEITQVEDQNISIKSQITDETSALNQQQSALQHIKDQLSALHQELETAKTKVIDLVAREAQYKNICQNATNNKESLKRRLKQIDEEEAKTTQKVTEFKHKVARAEEEFQRYHAQIDDLNQRIADIKNRLEENISLLSAQVKRVQTLELERNKAKSTYTTLKKMEDNFEWYRDGVRAIMKKESSKEDEHPTASVRGPENNGILGLMADILEPEPTFETVVEAVLGESLQYILVKDQETGIDSINYLQTRRAGRSGFIPVSSVKTIEHEHTRKPDPQKKLLNHVAVKPGFEKIAEALLGHVVVAADIQEAIKIYNSNGIMQTVVTRDGDIISHQGFMIGGSQDNLAGILTKKQELKRIDRHINKLNQKLESARHDQKELESNVRIVESELQQLIEQKNKVAQSEIEAEKDLYKATEDLKHTLRHLEIVNLEQERLLGETSDIDAEMSTYNQAIIDIESAVQAAQNQVTEKLEQISSLSSELDDFNQTILEHKLNLTALNAKLENSSNTLRRLKEYQSDGLKQLEQLSNDIAQKKQKQTDSKQTILEFEQTLSGRYDALQRLEAALQHNETDFAAIDAKLKDHDSTISEIQNKREKTLQKIRMLELEHSQQHIQRENIANRLEENYHDTIAAFQSEFGNAVNNLGMTLDKIEEKLSLCRKRIALIDDVNLGAIKEYEQLKERHDFLCEQRDDLVQAVEDLHKVIKKINKITQERFLTTFDAINQKLNEVFPRLFEGGSAKLVLTEPDKPLDTGVEYMIHPQGKKLTRMSLLSGGEKALAAIALIFSIFLIKPASFCLMDEIDATLDEANVFRFNDLLKIIGEKSQIIMITHNKKSMEFADTLFGITMENKGVSKVVTVNFERNAG